MEGEQQLHTLDPKRLTLTKALSIQRHPVIFRLSQPEPSQLNYELFSAQPILGEIEQSARDRIAFFLSLDDDLAPFYALGQADLPFKPILASHYGLHHVKFLTLAEIACWAILTQHTAIPIARKLKQALVAEYGSRLELEGEVYEAFPEFDVLRPVSALEFGHLVRNERQSQYLVNVISALSQADERWLRTAPTAELTTWLRQIKGIGEWSAAFILLRGLGHMDSMLLDLKPFLRLLPQVYDKSTTMAQLQAYYGKWFGYWGIYMRASA